MWRYDVEMMDVVVYEVALLNASLCYVMIGCVCALIMVAAWRTRLRLVDAAWSCGLVASITVPCVVAGLVSGPRASAVPQLALWGLSPLSAVFRLLCAVLACTCAVVLTSSVPLRSPPARSVLAAAVGLVVLVLALAWMFWAVPRLDGLLVPPETAAAVVGDDVDFLFHSRVVRRYGWGIFACSVALVGAVAAVLVRPVPPVAVVAVVCVITVIWLVSLLFLADVVGLVGLWAREALGLEVGDIPGLGSLVDGLDWSAWLWSEGDVPAVEAQGPLASEPARVWTGVWDAVSAWAQGVIS